MIQDILRRIDDNVDLNEDELVQLLDLEDPALLNCLYMKANTVRERYVGNEVHLRGLIEFSNFCRRNCLYCGIRRDNHGQPRYRMSLEELVETAALAEELGYRTVVLQSGEDMFFTVKKLESLLVKIKQGTDLAITLSIGERSKSEYQRLYDAGADRYLIRFETSNPTLYARLHPDSNFDERVRILSWLKDVGYQVGSGIMVGLPGQTTKDLAQDILAFRKFNLDMVGVGPYISHPCTPLAGCSNGTVEMTFKVIALTRIVTRNTHIPATTALATLRPADGREKALELGANVLMPNVTPAKYRAMYELYPNKICIAEESWQCQTCITGRVASIGRPISKDHGHSLKAHHDVNVVTARP